MDPLKKPDESQNLSSIFERFILVALFPSPVLVTHWGFVQFLGSWWSGWPTACVAFVDTKLSVFAFPPQFVLFQFWSHVFLQETKTDQRQKHKTVYCTTNNAQINCRRRYNILNLNRNTTLSDGNNNNNNNVAPPQKDETKNKTHTLAHSVQQGVEATKPKRCPHRRTAAASLWTTWSEFCLQTRHRFTERAAITAHQRHSHALSHTRWHRKSDLKGASVAPTCHITTRCCSACGRDATWSKARR